MTLSDPPFEYAMTVIETIIIGIGFIGNILNTIVFLRKTFRSNSISTYCIALSIFELLTLTKFVLNIYSLAYNRNLPDESDTLCKFFYTAPTFLSGIQPWIMVVFSVDKLLSMRMNSIAIIKKKWFQWSLVSAIVLINIGLFINIPISMKRSEIFPGYFMCDLSTISFYDISSIINLLETCLIPFIVMTITSILTIRVLIKSRNAVMKVGQLSKERKSRDTKYAVSSVTLNIIFIFLKLPITIFLILSSFYSYYDIYFFRIAVLTLNLNSSVSFFVHLATNSLFRREFLGFFGIAKDSNGTTRSNTISDTKRFPNRLIQVSPAP